MRRLVIALGVATLAATAAGCGSDAGRGPASPAGTTTRSPLTADPTPTTSSSPSRHSASAPSSTVTITSTPERTTPPPRYTPSVTRSAQPAGSRGSVVVLNPGHNGGNATHTAQINRQVPAGFGDYKACDTTGTNTNAGYPEHAFAFDLALRIRSILRAADVPVVLTRSDDSGVGPCVDERAADGNGPSVAAVISIHADGAPASGHGFHVNQDSRRPDGASAATARASVRLGEAIHGTLTSSSGLTQSNYIGTNGYVYRSDLAGLNLARRPATFLELGNMRNAGDAALLSSSAGRERLARSVAAGILVYLRAR